MSSTDQRGQAMVEMIVGVGVLVTMMLGTMIIARYVDIRSAAVQGSRYVAFERATNLKAVPDAEIERKLRARMFTVSNSPLRADDGLADDAQWRNENPNWKDPSKRNRRLVTEPKDVQVVTLESEPTSTESRALAAVVNGIDTVGDLVGSNFDLDTRAFHKGIVMVKLANLESMPQPLNALNLTFTERTALLTDSWQSGSPGAVAERTGALVPTRLFTEFSGELGSLLRIGLSVFEPSIDELCLGQINPEIVPADRLGGQAERGNFTPSC
jgi:hypothetical protein